MGEAQSGTKEREEMEAKRKVRRSRKSRQGERTTSRGMEKGLEMRAAVRGPPGGPGNLVQKKKMLSGD